MLITHKSLKRPYLKHYKKIQGHKKAHLSGVI